MSSVDNIDNVGGDGAGGRVLDDLARGLPFPKQSHILEAEITSATRVAGHIFDQSRATVDRPKDVRDWIKAMT